MADDPKYNYSQPDPNPSKEVLDLTKQMLAALKEMQSIESSSAEQKMLQRDLTQEALYMAIAEAQVEASRVGHSKSEQQIKRDILNQENLTVN